MHLQAVIIFLGLILSTTAIPALKAKSAKVYKGGEGVTVTIVRLDKKTAKEAVIQVSGTDTEIDEQPVLAEIKEGDGEDYTISWKGGRSNLLSRRSGLELFVPGANKTISLVYAPKESASANAADILAAFEKTQKK